MLRACPFQGILNVLSKIGGIQGHVTLHHLA